MERVIGKNQKRIFMVQKNLKDKRRSKNESQIKNMEERSH